MKLMLLAVLLGGAWWLVRWLRRPVPPGVNLVKKNFGDHYWKVTVDGVPGYEDLSIHGGWFVSLRVRWAASRVRRRAGLPR